MAPNNENQPYNTQVYAGDTADALQNIPFMGGAFSTQFENTISAAQASNLAPEVRMGDDHVLGDTPNWHGYSSQQLYDFAMRGNVPSTADALGRGFTDGGNRLAEAANGLFEAVTALEGAWTGVAADSARAALAPLAQAAGQTGQTAQMMGVQMSRQSVAATEVRKLPPPQEVDQQQAMQSMLTGGPAAMQADLRAQREAANAVKREQISYLEAYTRSMSDVDQQTPSFVPPPTGSINPDAGGGSRITGSSVPVPHSGGGFEGGTSTGNPGGGWVGAAPGSAVGGQTPAFGEGELDTGDLTIPGTIPNTSASGFTSHTPSVTPSVSPGGMPGSVPGGAPAAPAAGAGGFGGAFGNFGAGGGAGGTAAGAGGTGAGQGSGTGARGMGPTGAGAGGAGTTGGVTGRGGVGAGAMGAGGRKANGEDDDEHERPSYLVEGDPDSAFGSDQLTAPSVIGGDGNE
ncbi:hypothetical protein [Actinophytocola gossypii]|uniref:PPE domain-containing protein n=1 Tax=Actinophytocola gossypii TaxID=2812003 RepID=A0ABT2J4C8_9PSEU|nr:hypothetical protein [Actinophytocola gossypii]MCT2582536.1 hypothetical protein [Actinophytocola gossypii]